MKAHLLSEIKRLTEGKAIKVVTFLEIRKIKGDKEELRKAFIELVKEGKIRVRQGVNYNLIELL